MEGELFEEKIKVESIFLMHVGTESTADFKGNADFADLMVENEDIADMFAKGARIFQCKIHSHNKMAAFFSQGSGVSDQQDLEDVSKNHDLYVSIVVNNNMDFFAKACRWVTTEEITKTVKVPVMNNHSVEYTYTIPSRREMVIQNVNVKIDTQHPDWFLKRLNEIKPEVPVLKSYKFDPFQVPYKSVEKEVTFEDQLAEVFQLQKGVKPAIFFKTQKVDLNAMIHVLSTYTVEEENAFFDKLYEWIIDNKLEETKFANQLSAYLDYAESGTDTTI